MLSRLTTVKSKESEKKDKYRDLAMELKKLWNMKVTVIHIVSKDWYNKINKYNDQKIEIEKICRLKTTTVQVIVGVQGMIEKRADKHITIPSSVSLDEKQKIALCGTAHLPCRVPSL